MTTQAPRTQTQPQPQPHSATGLAPKRYLVNSPVLTAYGEFRFEGPLTLDTARAIAAQGTQSAIGHRGTALFLTRLLRVDVPTRRESVHMQPGDEALVLRLLQRLPEGSVLDAPALARLPHEFGLLTRLS